MVQTYFRQELLRWSALSCPEVRPAQQIDVCMSTSVPLEMMLIMFCIQRDLLERVGMGDQRVGDLKVPWPDDAVIYAVDMLGSHDTKFCRKSLLVKHPS